MGVVDWGLSEGAIDEFDRESVYKPYTGKTPPNGTYQWRVTDVKYVAGTSKKHPQLRAYLSLVPRDAEEHAWSGFRLVKYMNINDKYPGFFVPFLDAIGVSEMDFRKRTVADEEGKIKRIGKFRNNGETIILGQLADNTYEGRTTKEVKWCGACDDPEIYDEDSEEEDYDEDEYADDEDAAEEYDDEEDEGF